MIEIDNVADDPNDCCRGRCLFDPAADKLSLYLGQIDCANYDLSQQLLNDIRARFSSQ